MTQQEFCCGSYFLFSPHKPGSLCRNIGRTGLHLPNWFLRKAVAYRCKFTREISGRTVALVRVFRQTSLDSPTQRSGRVGGLHSDRFSLFPENSYQRLCYCLSPKGALSGHHLVEHQAEGELVRTEIRTPAAGLFRRHVLHRPLNHTRLSLRRGYSAHLRRLSAGCRELRQAKVEDFDESIARDHQVRRLYVPVGDPRFVRLSQPLGNLRGDFNRSFVWAATSASSSSRSVFPSTSSIAM